MSASVSPVSKHLGPLALKGVVKAGDILVPGTEKFPRFSETRFLQEIDRMVDYMNADDRGGFSFLMTLFALLPRPLVRGMLKLADRADSLPGVVAPAFRLINIGVKGAVYTLYFSDFSADGEIRRALSWDTHCGPDPLKEREGETPAAAFARARAAQSQLRRLSVKERVEILARLEGVILRNRDLIMDQVQKATGKSRSDALMSEIFPVLDHFHYLKASAAKTLADRKVPTPLALMGKKSRVWFEPMGTVLCICPWNYPFYQAVVPATLAIACGNTVVYKPSEVTPLRGLVERLFAEAGIPAGWMNLVYGDGKTGSELIEQRPDKIFFIGSARTGKKIMEQASRHLIPVELELGGKDPMIVFEDANLDRAVAGAAWGAFTNTGQSCTSVERLYVHERIYEKFLARLRLEAGRVSLGVDKQGDKDMGCMTSAAQTRIVAEQLKDAVDQGAVVLTGTSWNFRAADPDPRIPAIVVAGVTPSMKLYREETFGPVVPIIPFRSEEEVIQAANDSEYGLSASVWTGDARRAERVARALVTGNVSINNVMLTEANPALPFGGVKNSGFGRYKGEFGYYAFSNIKSVLFDGNSGKIEANWYPFSTEKYRLFTGMMEGLFGKGPGAFVKFALNGMKLEGHAKKSHDAAIRDAERNPPA